MLSLGLCASVVPMGVSAVTYDRHDVNHDGKINVDDYFYIMNYLSGKFTVASPSFLDSNKNNVVERADADVVWARAIGGVYSSVMFINYTTKSMNLEQSIPDELLAEDSEEMLFPSGDIAEPYVIAGPRTYYKYNCTKGTYTTYGLQPELLSQVSSLNEEESDINAISDNDVTKNDVLDGIVQLELTSHNSSKQEYGTGFIVGDHVIATAASNVFEKNGSKITDGFWNIKVQTCDTAGNINTEQYEVKEIHIPKAYVDGGSASVDYALLTVSENLSVYSQFEFGVLSSDSINEIHEIPLHFSYIQNDDKVYTSVVTKSKTGVSTEQNLCYQPTIKANSTGGAPLYTATAIYRNASCQGKRNSVVAINSGNGNSAAMNSYLMAFYKNNPYIGY